MSVPNRLLRQELPSPLGLLVAVVAALDSTESLCLLEFDHPARLSRELPELTRALGGEPEDGRTTLHDEVEHQLAEYFGGDRRSFDLPLATPGTAFQQRVWRSLCEIPFSQTRSYAQVAESIGAPGAQRAVGAANGANRIAIVVPCHRVIEAGGGLRGYGGGLARKRWLLEHEGAIPREPSLFGVPPWGEVLGRAAQPFSDI